MKTSFIFLFLIYTHVLPAQRYDTFTATLTKLYSPAAAEVDSTWDNLIQSQRIPFVVEDSVAFLYRGAATSVMWMGDFNGWGYDKKFQNKGTRIPGTDIWILKKSFPADARLDYRIILNDTDIIVDPVNPYQQWSGVGGGSINSELRMGRWKEDPIGQPLEAIFHGRVLKDLLIKSEHLGYQCMYSIYLPPDFRPSGKVYPILYVTDGYEYMHEKMGNMITILDNLIHLNKIRPVIVVFMDHREPVNRSNNRRMQELAMNDRYLTFLTEELIPRVEKNYPVST
ncbi:MAG TPA: alpha/beta hydrolase-fold protein, partial [Ohtaekwangia sp.]|nr:alpha/beta hydrolase-fold protein [Ohtaekwangia sp.]